MEKKEEVLVNAKRKDWVERLLSVDNLFEIDLTPYKLVNYNKSLT
jgi:hypothetical protein